MGESIFTRKGGGVELTGNATTDVVFSGYTFYSNNASNKLTGTFAFTGNATTANVASGKTFYATNGTKLTGTGTILGVYNTWAVQDLNGAKYTAYNGISTGTIGGNNTYAFNRWLLNNSTTNAILLANTVMATSNDVIVNIVSENQANMALINNSVNYQSWIFDIVANNGFVYVGGGATTNGAVRKYYESNLAFVGNTINYGSQISTLATNNGKIFVGGDGFTSPSDNRHIKAFLESDLSFAYNSVTFGSNEGTINNLAINNGFVYAVSSTGALRKYHESNLVLSANLPITSGDGFWKVSINNNYIYVSTSSGFVRKYHESNLTFVGNTANYGGQAFGMAVSNGFIYVGGFSSDFTIKKYNESTLAFVGNTANYGGEIQSVFANNGFVYAAGTTSGAYNNGSARKYHESNLVEVGNTANYGSFIRTVYTNNSFIYLGGNRERIAKYQEAEIIYNNTSLYEIKSLKEE